MKRFFLTIGIVFLAVLGGCSSSNGGANDRTTNFRVVNAVPDTDSVDFYLDAKPFLTNVGYLENSGYSNESTGSHKMTVLVTGSFTPLFDATISFADTIDYSLFIFGPSTKSAAVLSNDNNNPAGRDFAKLRVVNAASANTDIDVYVAADSQSISDMTPTWRGVGYRSVSKYVSSTSGNFSLIVTSAGSKEMLANKSDVSFNGDSVYTILVSDRAKSGDLPEITILQDR